MLNIDIDYSDKLQKLIDSINILGKGVMPSVDRALDENVNIVISEWQKVAQRSLKHSTGQYVAQIREDKDWKREGERRIACYHPAAVYLEHGTTSFDMKVMLFTSRKVRVVKSGKNAGSRYLIIPFHHGKSGAKTMKSTMPSSVYKKAKSLSSSAVTGGYKESNINRGNMTLTSFKRSEHRQYNPHKSKVAGFGAKRMKATIVHGVKDSKGELVGDKDVKRAKYDWGGRLTANDILDGIEQKDATKEQKAVAKKFSGLVKMEATGKGKVTRSKYMTFRVMSENSDGWQHPGIKAKKIATQTRNNVKETLQNNISEAAMRDIREITKSIGGA